MFRQIGSANSSLIETDIIVYYASTLARILPDAQVAERQHLRSASPLSILVVPRIQLDTVRRSCVRRDWSDRLERTEQQPEWSGTQHRQLRSPTEDAFIYFSSIRRTERIEAMCDNALEIDIDIDIKN